jgi:hypothetical protein
MAPSFDTLSEQDLHEEEEDLVIDFSGMEPRGNFVKFYPSATDTLSLANRSERTI